MSGLVWNWSPISALWRVCTRLHWSLSFVHVIVIVNVVFTRLANAHSQTPAKPFHESKLPVKILSASGQQAVIIVRPVVSYV